MASLHALLGVKPVSTMTRLRGCKLGCPAFKPDRHLCWSAPRPYIRLDIRHRHRMGALFNVDSAQQAEDLLVKELKMLVSLLPERVRVILEAHPDMPKLIEVVMDLGRPPLARFPDREEQLSPLPVTIEDLAQAVEQVRQYCGMEYRVDPGPKRN